MSEGRLHLSITDEASPLSGISEHLLNYTLLEGQLSPVLLNICFYLLQTNPFIKRSINHIAQLPNAVHRYLQRLITLFQVLPRASVSARQFNLLH